MQSSNSMSFSAGGMMTPSPAPSAPTTQAFSFGSATSTAPVASSAPSGFGFSFGGAAPVTSATQPAPTTNPTFSGFGGVQPTTTGLTMGFGAPAPAATTQFSFGAPAATAPVTASAPISFGLNLGGGGTVSSTSTQPTATTNTTFTGVGGAQTTTTGLTMGFGTPAQSAPTTQPFSFGSVTSTAPVASSAPSGFGFSFGGAAPVTSVPTQPTSTTNTTFTGLGGVHASGARTLGGVAGSSAKPEGRAVLDLPVPPELLQIVEELKAHMKNQKVKMSEVCRASDKNIDKVTEEVEETRLAVSALTNQVHRQVLFCNALMKDIQEEMKNLDMAMITKDTPWVLQNEISAPTSYFCNLVKNYQERMITYKREIERAETALTSLGQSSLCSSKDMVEALKGTKETVIALSAKVQDLHERIVNEATTNRNLRRFPGEETSTPTRRGHSVSGGFSGRPEHIIFPNYDQAYEKVNLLFATPQRSGGIAGGEYMTFRQHSTPILGNTSLSSPGPLFQTGSSTILGTPGGALKRTKH